MPAPELLRTRSVSPKSTPSTLLLILALVWPAMESCAASRNWNGGGANNNWNNSANWGGVLPASGDDLNFPGGAGVDATSLNNTNNFAANTVFRSITITGTNYVLRGNQVLFTNSGAVAISAQHGGGFNTVDFPMQFSTTGQSFECINAGGTLAVSGDINLNGQNLTAIPTGEIQISGLISGTGNLTKNGAGRLLLNGGAANTYVGSCSVNAGTLELNDSAGTSVVMITGNLNINNTSIVEEGESDQIADTSAVVFNAAGQFNMTLGASDTIGSLTIVNGGDVNTGAGTLTVNGNISGDAATGNPATISGNLSLGAATRNITATDATSAAPGFVISANITGGAGAGFTKLGTGGLRLSGANTYSGITTVSNGFIYVASDTAFGNNAAGTDLRGGSLLMEGVTVANESLTNNSTLSAVQGLGAVTSGWSSNVVLNADLDVAVFTTGLLDLSGLITGAGGITKSQPGTLRFSGTAGNNTYTGNTTVNEGVLELAKTIAITFSALLTIGDGVGGINADVVRYTVNNAINSSVPILVNESGLLDLDGFSDTVGLLMLVGGDISTGTGTLTMNNNLIATSTSLGSAANITGNLALGAAIRTFTVTNGPINPDLQLTAAVSGTGGITKAGDGQLSLNNSNSFSGALTINDGLVRLADDFAAGTVAGGVTVNNNGTVEVFSTTHIGAEPLTLNSSNAVTGALEGLTGSNSWAGTITLARDTFINVDAGDTLNLLGGINGTGALTKVDTGTLYFSGAGANTYVGVTTVNAGTLALIKSGFDVAVPGNLVIGDGAGGANADVVRILNFNQIVNTSDVTINSSGLLELAGFFEGIDELSGNGNVLVSGNDLYPGFGDGSSTFSGVISGTGGVQKNGFGTLTLTGNNTYTGLTTITMGSLLVNGSQPQSAVVVGPTGILGGSGTVGTIINTGGGVVAPGSSPGILTCSNATFAGATSDFTVELGGPTAGTNYDQLNVRGTNNLGGATLNVLAGFSLSTAPAVGDQFLLVNNDGAEAITGTFAGLANNAALTVNALTFRINYNGGDGNDAVLTLTNVAAAEAGLGVSSGNGTGTVDPNECNLLFVGVSNKTASAMTGITARLSSLTSGGIVVQPYSAYPDIPASPQKRTNTVPFQISTTPNFPCGENLQLELALQTSSHNSFAIPVLVPTGVPGAAQSFSNSTATAIPDGGTLNSFIIVSNIAVPIGKVTVSLHLTHPQDQDMDITLESPDGTIVELTSDNGGASPNYGNNCASRTTFDDAAGTAITGGVAPFVGTFRPEGRLTDFRGKPAALANGLWTLHVTDDSFNAISGTLQCWSINVSPATCTAGSGLCELCPDVVISSALGTNSLTQTNRLVRNGQTSVCGVPTNCPGLYPVYENHIVDAYTFRNGPSNTCISVTLEAPDADLFSAAYLNAFNPLDICDNYIGDSGDSTIFAAAFPPSPTRTYTFNVASNAVFVVTVNDVHTGGGPYRLHVSGGDCRPVLNITALPGNRALLDWTTAAAGYGLERTNTLVGGATGWSALTNPLVVNSRFTVTNNVGATTNQFYRLRKPLP